MSTILASALRAFFTLGLGESGNFPRLSKNSPPNGFPKKETRAGHGHL